MSLKEYLKSYEENEREMNSLNLSIRSKEEKLQGLYVARKYLAEKIDKDREKRFSLTIEEIVEILSSTYGRAKDKVKIEIQPLRFRVSKDLKKSATAFLNMLEREERNNFKIHFTLGSIGAPIMYIRSFSSNDTQADGKPFYKHINMIREEGSKVDYVQLDVVEPEKLIMSFPVSESLSVKNGFVRFEKGFKGNLLKYAIEKEESASKQDDLEGEGENQ